MITDWISAVKVSVGHMAAFRRNRAPLVFLDQRWSSHGSHSGYLISQGVGPVLPRNDRLFPHPLNLKLQIRLKNIHWEKRLITYLLLKLGRSQVMHMVDGDFDCWAYERRAKWLPTKITATFHQPVDRLAAITDKLKPGMLDAIVCVSRNQVPHLSAFVPPGRCTFIPHGVDTEFFCDQEPTRNQEGPIVLTVGTHRRDFDTLISAAKLILAKRANVRFRLIGPEKVVARVREEGIIETASNVSDEELRAAYREATLVFLPLEQTSANNALLESMACGRASVITDLPAIRDYTAEDSAILCPLGDSMAHANAVLKLLEDDALRGQMERAAYSRSKEFAWPKVRLMLTRFLMQVDTTLPP